MQTEFLGSKYRAMFLEATQLPWSSLLFRLRFEAARRIGLHKNRYAPSCLTTDDVLSFFPLNRPSPAALLDYFRTRKNVAFFFERADIPKIRTVWQQRCPAARDPLIAAANRICAREFSFLGSEVNAFPNGISWHDEMDGGGRWPLRHWSTIDIRFKDRTGDCKRTWELNRTQFFVTLARAYALTEDERYARELTTHFRSWIEQNPPEMGINWYSNLECAIRCTSWLFAIEMTLDWPGWDPKLFADVIRCLIDHHHHLVADIALSEKCMVGNHLLGDAMGICMLSLYLPELDHSAGYLDIALPILVREGPKEIYEDGVNFENAISYHRFVFYIYLLAGLLLERNGRNLPEIIWQRLAAMCEFVIHMRTPGGQICQVGDWDNGRTIVLDDSSEDDFKSMLCAGAVRFQNEKLKAAAGEFREESLWLIGPDAAQQFDKLECKPPEDLDKAHSHGGFYMWRSDWTNRAEFVMFKCAPFIGHSHADNLSVLYSAGGKDWLVDRGTYTYNGDWHWRTYFRGTRAHNAIVTDGFGQALAHRVFRWLKHPKQRVLKYHTDGRFGYASGITQGQRHLTSVIRHARSVLLAKGQYLLVLDVLDCPGTHTHELLWHIAPQHELTASLGGLIHTNDADGPNLWMRAIGSSELGARIAVGETDPIQGWHSRSYGHKEPAPTVIYKMEADGPIFFLTLLCTVSKDAGEPRLTLRAEGNPVPTADRMLMVAGGPGFDDRISLPNPLRSPAAPFPENQLWVERAGEKIPIL
ncbi:MAG: alginate lyase family protein [Planctomycetota bacterium]|nr:alginate lyase family protein [Planctomycetota bacterium]